MPEEFWTHYNQFKGTEISGLLCWAYAMDWDVHTINEDLSGYDTFLINFSSTESEYGSVIRQVVPDAILIGVFDYGFSVIDQYFNDLSRIKTVMDRCDHIISVNRNQVEWMEHLLPDRTIHYCPHPTDVQNMMRYRRKPEDRTMGIASMWHQYSNMQLQSLEILKAVERKLKKPFRKTLIGLKSRIMADRGIRVLSATIPLIGDDHPDEKLRGQPIDPLLPQIVENAPPGVAWDGVIPYLGVDGWYSFLSQFYCALDLYTVDSIGRFGMDCAGVGVPCAASSKQDSSKLLFPLTTSDPFSPEGSVKFITKLLNNQEFYEKVERIAANNLHHFDFPTCKARMLRILDESG